MTLMIVLALALGVLAMILVFNVLPRLSRLEGRQTALETQLNRIEQNTAISAEVSRQIAVRAGFPPPSTIWNIDQVQAARDAHLGGH